jgi:hypothetical protein
MVEVELVGGLGNWLFQYSAGRALALRHRVPLALDLSRYVSRRDPFAERVVKVLNRFHLSAGFIRLAGSVRRALEAIRLRERRRFFEEKVWGYDPAFFALDGQTRLLGYFQSPAYWGSYEDTLRSEIAPRSVPDDPRFRSLSERIDGCEAVSVHVRRGDYLASSLHNVCSPSYYAKALREMRAAIPGARFFVFSDDAAWCEANLAGPDVVVLDLHPGGERAVADLLLMGRCRHHIVANSTYSWWGAWLNHRPDKRVIVPDRWFNDPAMDRLAMSSTVPPGWQRIPAGT